MKTEVKIFVGVAACFALFGHPASAQNSAPSSVHPALDETLFRSVCERVQTPLVFSTRDSVFALSLPVDEPAEVYVQLTVGRNGKVKGKLTRVSANHIGGYVAPAFIAATKELRVDRSLLAGMAGKDTVLLLTFPLEYQCVYDTISKAWPTDGYETPEKLVWFDGFSSRPVAGKERDKRIESHIWGNYLVMREKYMKSDPTSIWYYFAFIKD